MNLPLELIIKIFEFLPSKVIFKLWCTGRELHGIRSIYIDIILPYIKKTTLLKLENYQKSFYIEIDDKGPLKEYGIIKCDLNIVDTSEGKAMIFKFDNVVLAIPTYTCFCDLSQITDRKSIVVIASFCLNDGDIVYHNGYYLEKIEFTTRYYFFSFLKLKLSNKTRLPPPFLF